ncbi:MAG: hypothetical protein ABS35_09490 [Kaistia sp. SCN 65-12]|nr:MAG: hypothetical protein ABS35_09490 [Kaistia sp. SCN 65-12]
MVKTPKTRHSKSHREPVTIELQPDEVSRVAEEAAPADRPAEEAAGPATDADTDADSDIGGGFDELPPRPRADAADERQEDAVSAGSIPPRTGGPNPILAGLAGALIALAGAGALQYAGVLGAPGASLDAVDSQVAALKTQVAALAGAESGGDVQARMKVVADAVDQTKAELADLKASVDAAAGDRQAVAEMRDKVAVLETTVAELGKSAGVADADLAPLNDRIAALDALAKGSADAASEQQARLGALEQSVMQLATKVEAQASQPKIALSIAASALKATLDRGAPFAAELETFAAIAPDAPQLALLRPYAEKGVATRAEIAAGMDDAANAMVAAATPPDADAGFFQSLMASAERLVKVRPIGAVEGSGVPETVARMEAAVDQGDYAGAIAEYDTLPEAVKAAGAELAGKLKARLEVETGIDALVADAMKA